MQGSLLTARSARQKAEKFLDTARPLLRGEGGVVRTQIMLSLLKQRTATSSVPAPRERFHQNNIDQNSRTTPRPIALSSRAMRRSRAAYVRHTRVLLYD